MRSDSKNSSTQSVNFSIQNTKAEKVPLVTEFQVLEFDVEMTTSMAVKQMDRDRKRSSKIRSKPNLASTNPFLVCCETVGIAFVNCVLYSFLACVNCCRKKDEDPFKDCANGVY